jgi:hypothetical protein
MYEENRAEIDQIKARFDRQIEQQSVEARRTADEYLTALGNFVEAFNNGPGADAHLMNEDTTGELHRVEDRVAWAELERHRVRRALLSIA